MSQSNQTMQPTNGTKPTNFMHSLSGDTVPNKSKIGRAIERVNREIAESIHQDSLFSRGLAREGYLGGYVQALMDVRGILRGIEPTNSRTREFWK